MLAPSSQMRSATIWNTPSMERAPVELWRPVKQLWSESPRMADMKSSNWYGTKGYVLQNSSQSW